MLSAALISFLFTDKKCRLWQPHFTVVLRCSFFQPKDLQCILAVVRLWLFSCDINFLVEMVMFAGLMSAMSELSQYMCVYMWQVKLVLEKSKQQLEARNTEMENELKQVSSARQEADRKRKQAEQQLQEVSVKLGELEKTRGDLGDKAAKCQVWYHCLPLTIILWDWSDSMAKEIESYWVLQHTTRTTHLMALHPGRPRWAGTRRNVYSLTLWLWYAAP